MNFLKYDVFSFLSIVPAEKFDLNKKPVTLLKHYRFLESSASSAYNISA
jgi:hypothetical protein